MPRALWILPLLLAGCTSDEKYIIVTVQSRPAVHDVAMLRVTLSNAGSMRTEDLPVGSSATFPATFSISPQDRTGDLGISVEAYDKDNGLIGRGSAQSAIEAAGASVLLEPTDFVINTEYAEDQQLSNYFGAAGLQLAATQNGTWTSVYNASCSTPCNVFGRRFDATARPVSTVVAAGTQGFPVSTQLTTYFSTPTVAMNATTTLTVWNNQDPVASTYSIQCRALDASGAAASSQLLIATDDFPDLVAATALPSGNFGIVWDSRVTNNLVRTAILRPDCMLVGAIGTASQAATTDYPHRSHLAANSANILYAWTVDGSVHVRAAKLDGTFVTNDTQLIAKTATEQVDFVRVAPLPAGFALLARWSSINGTGPGRIDLYRLSSTGVAMGTPTLVSDRTGSDFSTRESFGVAARDDGSLFVVWHACMEKGDGSGCGVLGRLLRPAGDPAGAEIVLATTTTNDQTRPSAVALPGGAYAVAWTDRSGAAPDMSGSAVRARIVYPGVDPPM
jgi:hypothetical protein